MNIVEMLLRNLGVCPYNRLASQPKITWQAESALEPSDRPNPTSQKNETPRRWVACIAYTLSSFTSIVRPLSPWIWKAPPKQVSPEQHCERISATAKATSLKAMWVFSKKKAFSMETRAVPCVTVSECVASSSKWSERPLTLLFWKSPRRLNPSLVWKAVLETEGVQSAAITEYGMHSARPRNWIGRNCIVWRCWWSFIVGCNKTKLWYKEDDSLLGSSIRVCLIE